MALPVNALLTVARFERINVQVPSPMAGLRSIKGFGPKPSVSEMECPEAEAELFFCPERVWFVLVITLLA